MPLPAGLLRKPPVTPPTFSPDFYVSPTGNSTNSGTSTFPWSLSWALGGAGGALTPGKLVALRGGIYSGTFTSTVAGTPSSMITFRQFPGERAIIDNRLTIQGADVAFQGFEVTDASPAGKDIAGIYHQGTRTKLINLVVHDTSSSGILTNPSSPDGEITGCLVYNCGTHFNQDHGVYATNTSGQKLLRDNIVFNNEKYGLHLWGNAFHEICQGNVIFGNGSISVPVPVSAGFIIGSGSADGVGFQLTDNYFYDGAGTNWAAQLGTSGPGTGDMLCTGNIFMGYIDSWSWVSATFSNNTLYSTGNVIGVTPSFTNYTWAANAHFRSAAANAWSATGSTYNNYTPLATWKTATGLGGTDTNPATTPSGTLKIVRANPYETGRGHVIIYNWDSASSVTVDLSTILTSGQAFTITNAQDFFGTPLVSATYTGGPVNISMAGIAAPAPVGRSFNTPPVTGPLFQAFVVRLQGA